MRTSITFAAVLMLAMSGVQAHAADPAIRCVAAKNRVAGKYYHCRHMAIAKTIQQGAEPDYAKCGAQFEEKWNLFEAQGGGSCPDIVSSAEMNAYIAAQPGVGLLGAYAGDAKCLAAKSKLIGQYYLCREKAQAKAVTGGTDPNFSKCTVKFEERWERAEANGGASCPSSMPTSAIRDAVAAEQNDVAAIVAGAAIPTCGDGIINVAGEECDGDDFSGESCATFGHTYGSLSCTSCQIDTSGCYSDPPADPPADPPFCGDGIVNDAGEQCDGADFAGQTCSSFGYSEGTLSCTSCQIDISGCYSDPPADPPANPPFCGDGMVNYPDEQCDGADFAGQSCPSLGYGDGTLSCTNCQIDTSACGALPPEEVPTE